MKVEWKRGTDWPGRFTSALVFEDSKTPLGLHDARNLKLLSEAAEEGFRGQYKKTILLRTGKGKRLLLAGLGKKPAFELDRVRVAAAVLAKLAESAEAKELGLILPAKPALPCDMASFVSAAVQGAILASYRYTEHRTPKPDEAKPIEALTLLLDRSDKPAPLLSQAATEAARVAEATCYVRDLVNETPSRKPPKTVAELANSLARPGRVTVEVMHKDDLVRLGMNGILMVGAGSHEPPCLVHLIYKPRTKPKKTICIIGKGITFDSGGLSLKPSNAMDTMKDDMAGAATVLGLFKLLGETDLPLAVHGLAPLAENLPGGGAQKLGDVIRAFGRKTIEVLNTDAEGRLILADALAYGSDLKPDLMIDIATLTGACVVALGDECSALLGTDQKTIDAIEKLGSEQGELFWQLPLVERYRSHLKSNVADVKNIGKPQNAGTIIGGLFLQEFVGRNVPWVHIDIAGAAFTKEGWDYAPAGATGVPLRTIYALLHSLA